MIATIFKNIFSKEPHFISIDKALERIKTGASQNLVLEIRTTLDKEKANKIKLNLPSVCFSGKFGKDRKDEQLIEHSGFSEYFNPIDGSPLGIDNFSWSAALAIDFLMT